MSVTAHTHGTAAHGRPQPRSFWARLGHLFTLRKERQKLLSLDDHLLNDIGVTRAQAVEESRQSPWNAPDHWHN